MSIAANHADSLVLVENLHTHYGKSHILHGVSLKVARGEVVGLLGRNGVGKSTTLKTIMGLVRPSAGKVELEGRSITGLPAHKLARLGIGYVPEDRRIFRLLTVMENLRTGFDRQGVTEVRRQALLEKVFAFFPVLAERRRQPGGTLSGGEQQMLAIGRGLMAEPKLLILDEPSLGLSPLLVEELFALMRRINKEGIALLLVEQNVVQCLEVARRAYILEEGMFVLHGKSADIREDPNLKRAYLGL